MRADLESVAAVVTASGGSAQAASIRRVLSLGCSTLNSALQDLPSVTKQDEVRDFVDGSILSDLLMHPC